MTRNLVPRHIFLQHETEWQAVRQAAERLKEATASEKPALQIVYGDKSNAAERASPSAA
jgi:hypothetical protein